MGLWDLRRASRSPCPEGRRPGPGPRLPERVRWQHRCRSGAPRCLRMSSGAGGDQFGEEAAETSSEVLSALIPEKWNAPSGSSSLGVIVFRLLLTLQETKSWRERSKRAARSKIPVCALFHPGQHTLQRVLPCQPMARSRGEQQPGSRRTRFHTSSHLVGQASQSHVALAGCPD